MPSFPITFRASRNISPFKNISAHYQPRLFYPLMSFIVTAKIKWRNDDGEIDRTPRAPPESLSHVLFSPSFLLFFSVVSSFTFCFLSAGFYPPLFPSCQEESAKFPAESAIGTRDFSRLNTRPFPSYTRIRNLNLTKHNFVRTFVNSLRATRVSHSLISFFASRFLSSLAAIILALYEISDFRFILQLPSKNLLIRENLLSIKKKHQTFI